MAGKKQAPRQKRERRPFSRPMRYDQRTVREEREYGVYWYAWLWRVLRPVTVFFCAVLIVIGLVTMGWNSVYEAFLMPVDPENTQTVRFTIESGDSISEIGENLEEAQLLRNHTVFRYLVQFLGVTDKISYGTFDLSPSMDVNAIIDELSSGSQNAERTITIIPGWTVEDIADYLYAEGAIQSREEFLNLCRDAAPFAEMSYPIKLALSDEETSAVNNYNTYVIDGLPVGPICNPSAAAMEAALYPDVEYVDEGYLYFCAKEPTSGELAFAKTLEEHEANVARYRPLWEEYDRQRAQQQSASDTNAQ